ncbi:hypothetical protein FACS1894151_08350 [Spirochaetia bacterium]|nr:hypothetical protein FACS1894151_08350 [Spirochaetia bacterium]
MAYLNIVFDIPLDRSFSYAMDAKGEAAVGKRAMVPFGRRGERAGFIVGTQENLPEGLTQADLKQVRRVIDAEPVFDEETISIALWIAG